MRIARDFGGVSQLLPRGIDGLADCPYTLHSAILGALRILDYHEFPLDERPPRRIWFDGKRLEEWWADVERKRNAKYTSPGDVSDEDAQENAVELITRG